MDQKMRPDELIRMSLLSSALSLFVDAPVLHVDGGDGNEYGESFNFLAYNPTGEPKEGFIEHNYNGNYNVWLEGELTYEVEGALFDLLKDKKKGLISFYEKIRELNYDGMKRKSKIFVDIVLDQAENLISNPIAPIEPQKNIKIGNHFVFADIAGNKYVINLN